MGVATFEKHVRELWKLNSEIEIIILGFGYYLINFDNDNDHDKVMLKG